jgi:hypothetical protein
MAQKIIQIGTGANDGTGDPLRTCFQKINDNFTEIYSRDAAGSNFDLSGNTITTINTNGDIVLDPSGTGKAVVQDDSFIIAVSKTPASSVGEAGDRAGMIAWDSDHIYVCLSLYDGTSNIWKRTAISTW